MRNDTVISFNHPEEIKPLREIMQEGARKQLASAVEAVSNTFLPNMTARPGRKFNSTLIPPYLKRTQSIEEFLHWLYLRGISTGVSEF